jgi:hypothetical protein
MMNFASTLLDLPEIGSSDVDQALRNMVEAAERGPSGDNLQPWPLIRNCDVRTRTAQEPAAGANLHNLQSWRQLIMTGHTILQRK